MLTLLGGKTQTEGPDRNFRRAHTVAEFEAAWEDKGIRELQEVQVMEVFLDKKDVSIDPGIGGVLHMQTDIA